MGPRGERERESDGILPTLSYMDPSHTKFKNSTKGSSWGNKPIIITALKNVNHGMS